MAPWRSLTHLPFLISTAGIRIMTAPGRLRVSQNWRAASVQLLGSFPDETGRHKESPSRDSMQIEPRNPWWWKSPPGLGALRKRNGRNKKNCLNLSRKKPGSLSGFEFDSNPYAAP